MYLKLYGIIWKPSKWKLSKLFLMPRMLLKLFPPPHLLQQILLLYREAESKDIAEDKIEITDNAEVEQDKEIDEEKKVKKHKKHKKSKEASENV